MAKTNDLGQPVGTDLGGWTAPSMIPDVLLEGTYSSVRPLTETDSEAIYTSLEMAPGDLFTYMSFDPFQSRNDVTALISFMTSQPDWRPYAIEMGGVVEGFASYLRINPNDGVIEIGSIMLSPRLQRTTAATESIYLMMSHAFDSGYRRVEWKCDALNEPSRRAGQRLGFRYEGTFLNATHYKGRNRDTAWFSMTSEEWPGHRQTLEAWLNPENFDDDGSQLSTLGSLRQG